LPGIGDAKQLILSYSMGGSTDLTLASIQTDPPVGITGLEEESNIYDCLVYSSVVKQGIELIDCFVLRLDKNYFSGNFGVYK